MAPLRAAVLVPFAVFTMASACGTSTSGESSGGGGACAAINEGCSAVIDAETGQPDTSLGPACCHGKCFVCAQVGADNAGICLDAPYCCPAGQQCHDNSTCCSGVCAGQEPTLVGGMIGTCM